MQNCEWKFSYFRYSIIHLGEYKLLLLPIIKYIKAKGGDGVRKKGQCEFLSEKIAKIVNFSRRKFGWIYHDDLDIDFGESAIALLDKN